MLSFIVKIVCFVAFKNFKIMLCVCAHVLYFSFIVFSVSMLMRYLLYLK